MPNTVVIALDLPKAYCYYSFKQQLQALETHIQKLKLLLKNEHSEADEWVIAWREYGVTNNIQDLFLDKEQKALFKATMQKLTEKTPKLTIMSGTIATKRLVSVKGQETWRTKVNRITEAYKENGQFQLSEEFKRHRNQSTYLSTQDFYLLRNTAYIFSQGTCSHRHDKITPYQEARRMTNGIFRPGSQRSGKNVINSKFGIEICMEHQSQVLAKKIPQETLPLVQMILSASTGLSPKACVSPYVIHIDSKDPIRLLTDFKAEHSQIALYSSDPLSTEPKLNPISPLTLHDFVLIEIGEEITSCSDFAIEDYLYNNKGNAILQGEDYVGLLHLAAKVYIQNTNTENIASEEDKDNQDKLENLQPSLEFLLREAAPHQALLEEDDKEALQDLLHAAIENDDSELVEKILSLYQNLLQPLLSEEAAQGVSVSEALKKHSRGLVAPEPEMNPIQWF